MSDKGELSDDLEGWDPRKEAYDRKDFNSYNTGHGKDLAGREKEDEVKLYIQGIPNELTEEGVTNLFCKYGEVLSVKKCQSKFPEQGDTFGFVTYKTVREAEAAIRNLHNFSIGRFTLRIKIAITEEERNRRKAEKQREEEFLQTLGSEKISDPEGAAQTDETSKSSGHGTTAPSSPKDRPSTMNGFSSGGGTPRGGRDRGMGRGLLGVCADKELQEGERRVHRPIDSGAASADLNTGEVDTSVLHSADNSRLATPIGHRVYPSPIGHPEQYQDYASPGCSGPPYPGRHGDDRVSITRETVRSVEDLLITLGGHGRQVKTGDGAVNVPETGTSYGRGYRYQTEQDVQHYRGRGGGRGNFRARGSSRGFRGNYRGYNSWRGRGGYQKYQYHNRDQYYYDEEDYHYGNQGQYDQDQHDDGGYEYQGRYDHREQYCKQGYGPPHRGYHAPPHRGYHAPPHRGYHAPPHRGYHGSSQQGFQGQGYRGHKHQFQDIQRSGQDGYRGGRGWREHPLRTPDQAQSVADTSMSQASDAASVSSEKSHVKLKPPCNFCSKPGSKKCKICKTPYCSMDCQQQDWNTHRQECKQIRADTQAEEDLAQRFEVAVDDVLVDQYKEALVQYQADNAPVSREVKQPGSSNTAFPPTASAVATRPVVLPRMQLTLHKAMEGIVTWVCDPCTIYVHIFEDVTLYMEFMELSAKMTSTYASGGKVLGGSAKVGDYCAVLYQLDGTWYRARVEKVEGPNKVLVSFVDYGNTDVVAESELKQIDGELLQCPAQAICCSLAGCDGDVTKQWSRECMDLTREVLPINAKYILEPVKQTGEIFSVNFTYYEEKTSVNEKLLKQLQAKEGASAAVPESKAEMPTEHPLFLADKLARAMDGVKAGDDLSIIIIDASCPGDFIAQLYDRDKIAAYQNFSHQMNKFYDDKPHNSFQPRLGELIVARYSDNKWYRAKVLEIQNNSVVVTYIDFGNKGVCSLDNIRIAGQRCRDYPVQAVTCGLAGIQPVTDAKVVEQCLEYFPGLPGVRAVVKSKMADRLLLDIYASDNGMSLSGLLVSKNLAVSDGKIVIPTVTSAPVIPAPQSAAPPAADPVSTKDFPVVKLTMGQMIKVTCPELQPDGTFFVQSLAEENNVNLITMNCLDDVYKARDNSTLYTPAFGELICAKFTDESWYRASVVAVNPDGAFHLYFVDFGNTETVSPSCVQNLQPEFATFPCQAIRCKLAGCEATVWTPEYLQVLAMTILEQEFSVELVKEADGYSHLDVYMEEGKRVNSGFSHLDVYMEEGKHVNSGFSGQQNGTAAGAGAPTGAIPKTVDVESSQPGAARPISSAFPVAQLPLDQWTKVTCVGVLPDGSFHVQWMAEENLDKLIPILQLNDEYRTKAPVPVTPQVGELVCAKFTDDAWYRASVQMARPNGTCQLYFIDYGNDAKVSGLEIQKLDTKFAQFPAQAIPCKLARCEKTLWSDDLLDGLKQAISDQELTVKLVREVSGCSFLDVLLTGEDLLNNFFIDEPGTEPTQAPAPPAPAAVPPPEAAFMTADLPVIKLPTGQWTDVMCVGVLPDGTFYLQWMAKQNQASLLAVHNVNEEYKDHVTVTITPEVGRLVCAKFSDNIWYRASVQSVNPDGTYQLYFIDYGNTASMPAQNIQKLDAKFAQFPSQAFKCRLARCEKTVWTQQFIEGLSAALSDSKLSVKAVLEEDGCTYLDVILEGETLLNSYFIEAEPNPPVVQRPVVTLASLGRVKLTPAECDMMVTAVVNPGDFYCLSPEGCTEAVNLTDKVHEACANLPHDAGFKPQKNQVCAAIYDVDHRFSRAAVVADVTADTCEVMYIDFGNTATVPYSNIRPLTPEFHTPAFAIQCQIPGLSSRPDGSWPESATELLCKCMAQLVQVEVLSEQGGLHQVRLLNTGVDVGAAIRQICAHSPAGLTAGGDASNPPAAPLDAEQLRQQNADLQQRLQALEALLQKQGIK